MKSLLKPLKSILSTATLRESSITFSGTVINGALGGIFYILAARFLGPASFGLMNVAIATLTLVADIGDLGTDTGLVRFVGNYLKKDVKKADRFLKLGLEVKLVVSLFVLFVGWLVAPFVATTLFAKPELTMPLRISFIGVGGALLFSFGTHSLQAFQKFWSWSGIQVGTNFLRVVVILLLLFLNFLSLDAVLATYIAMPFAGFLIGVFLIPRNFFKAEKEMSVAKEFFHYNKWVAAFTFLSAFGARLDTFISARLLSAAELGIYSAAQQLVQIVPQIVTAIGTVLAPKMAGMGSIEDLVSYIKKTQLMVVVLALLGILAIPVVLFLIPLLFGVEYVSSGPLFVVLFFGALIFLISVPVHMAVFYYFSYPKLFFWVALGHVLIVVGLGWVLISAMGAMGAAITVLVGHAFNFVVPTAWVVREIRRRR